MDAALAGVARDLRPHRGGRAGGRGCRGLRRRRARVGVERPGPVSLVLGTSGVVFAALPAYQPDPQARVHVFCHAVPGGWHAMGVMLSAAGSLQWARDTFAPGVPFDAAHGRGRGARPQAPAASSSCPTSRASARPMPTRTRAALSSG